MRVRCVLLRRRCPRVLVGVLFKCRWLAIRRFHLPESGLSTSDALQIPIDESLSLALVDCLLNFAPTLETGHIYIQAVEVPEMFNQHLQPCLRGAGFGVHFCGFVLVYRLLFSLLRVRNPKSFISHKVLKESCR